MSSALLRVAESVRVAGFDVPLMGCGNIWVEDSVTTRDSIGLTQSVIEEALTGTQAGQLEVFVFDDGLSGLSAPFEPINSGGEKLLEVTHALGAFTEFLSFLRDHIQSVNNVVQGLEPSLVRFRNTVDYPVEGYKLVVVSTDVSLLDEDLQNQLSTLLRAGPRAGVSFLVHSVRMGVEFLSGMCEVIGTRSGTVRRGDQVSTHQWEPPQARQLIDASARVAVDLASSVMDPVAFDQVERSEVWTGSSADGITFALGRYGLSTVDITLGDELNQRHNMLVTGAVGQGKSNLLSVMIHSLCQRYSPDELELFLLDLKEGVTLQAFQDPLTGVFLPHARVLGLETDREFGHSVLQHLFETYRRRMAIFKAAGVQNLRQYRELDSDRQMPRIVLMVDEFQMMFAEKDRLSDAIADLLVRGARLFRACGIHIVLASQTIGGNLSLMGSAGEGLFGQVPVRIALKNSLSESHATLGVKNDAASHLRAREAIVNIDYGAVSANRKTSIAYADEQFLRPLREDWWRRASGTAVAPYVFEGERVRDVADDLHTVQRGSESRNGHVLLLGQQIQVEAKPLSLPFQCESGRNVAVVGGGPALEQVLNLGWCLAVQGPPAEFVILDCLDQQDAWTSARTLFTSSVQRAGHRVRIVGRDGVGDELERLTSSIGSRSEEGVTYVMGFGLDRCREMPTGFGELIKTGPVEGVQTIGWWRKFESFREHVGYGGDAYFEIKIAMRLDPQTVRQFLNEPLLEWRPRHNRAIIWDATEMTQPQGIVPYGKFTIATTRSNTNVAYADPAGS